MDTDTLVDTLIEDGRRLVSQLIEDGMTVLAACWVKSADEPRWTLYIATPLIDQEGPLAAYREVVRVLRSLGETELSTSDIVLIGEKHPITSDVLSILRRHSGINPTWTRRPSLGGFPIEEVYVYPSSRHLAHTDLSDEHKQLLVDLYNKSPLAVDDLPYTDEMERIHREFVRETGSTLTVRDVFKALKNLGRQGRLGGKVRAQTAPDGGNAPQTPPENASQRSETE
jgi:hypothetical protein